jgi:hypothetical protein
VFGNASEEDRDRDGEYDLFRYTFSPETVADNLILHRSMELSEEQGEARQTITIRLEEGSGPVAPYDHIETIPKEFAEHVSELSFSFPPDGVIEEDPKVYWRGLHRKLAQETYRTMTIAKVTQPASNVGRRIGRGSYAAHIAGVFATLTAKCNEEPPELRSTCLLELAEEVRQTVKGRFIESTGLEVSFVEWAREICSMIPMDDPILRSACLARVNDDPKMCEGNVALETDLCLGYVAEAACTRDLDDRTKRDECLFAMATLYKSTIACELIEDRRRRQQCEDNVGEPEWLRSFAVEKWFWQEGYPAASPDVQSVSEVCRPLAPRLTPGDAWFNRSLKLLKCSFSMPGRDKHMVVAEIDLYHTDQQAAAAWPMKKLSFLALDWPSDQEPVEYDEGTRLVLDLISRPNPKYDRSYHSRVTTELYKNTILRVHDYLAESSSQFRQEDLRSNLMVTIDEKRAREPR